MRVVGSMTTLRQQFIRELVLRGMSPKTQDAYVAAVYGVAKHYHQSPEQYELFADMEGGDSDAESVERTKIAQAFPEVGKKLLFVFDYGDEWRFQVQPIALGEKTPKTRYPRLIAAVGEAPSQYGDDEDEEEEQD